MGRSAKIQLHLPVLFRSFDPLFGHELFDARFDVFGAPGHVLGGAVSEEAFGKFIPAIRFAAFLHFRQPADVHSRRAELGDLVLLVLPGLSLLLAFHQFLFEIIGVVAWVGFDAVCNGVQLEDGCHCVVQKSPVMRNDQGRALEAVHPALQPLEHLDIEMIGGLIEQE